MHTDRILTCFSSDCVTSKLICSRLTGKKTDNYVPLLCPVQISKCNLKIEVTKIIILNGLYLLYLCLVAVICYAISLNVTFLNTKFAKSELQFPPFLAIFGLFYHFLTLYIINFLSFLLFFLEVIISPILDVYKLFHFKLQEVTTTL